MFRFRNSTWAAASSLAVLLSVSSVHFLKTADHDSSTPSKQTPTQPQPTLKTASSSKFIGLADRFKVTEIDARQFPKSSSSTSASARLSFFQEFPGAEIAADSLAGTPSHVQSLGKFLTPKSPNLSKPEIIANFIDAYPALFLHDSSLLQQSKLTRQDVTQHNGLSTLVWQQEIDSIPVFEATLKANVTRDGELVQIGSHLIPLGADSTHLSPDQRRNLIASPPIALLSAVERAAANLGESISPSFANDPPLSADGRQRLKSDSHSDLTASLLWMPRHSNDLRLSWDVILTSLQRGEMYRIIIDAQTGETLLLRSLTSAISDATFRVFADPLTKKPADSPTPMSPGFSSPTTAQPPLISRNLVTLSNINPTASPAGWINDGDTETSGNNVSAQTDLNADNNPDLPRPNGGPTRTFDFPIDFAQEPVTYKDASVTQLFYYCNWIHDRLYELGFTESAGNFQLDNFGRTGLGSDPILADAQDSSSTNNANFSSPPDGSPGRLQMFVWTGPTPDRDGDFDGEVVLHEYVHGLTNRLVGGGIGISANQTRAMGEGWSDWYPLAMLGEEGEDLDASWARGGYSRFGLNGNFENYFFGARRYPYSTDRQRHPLTLKDIDPTQAIAHTGVLRRPGSSTQADQVHNAGEVWCVTLWEIRKRLIQKHGFTIGNETALQLVTDGLKLAPANPNYLQARNGILQADLVNNAGANNAELWSGFACRGMGLSATSPPSSTHIGIVEAFDVPGPFNITPAQSSVTQGLVGGPFTVDSISHSLTNNASTTISWTVNTPQSWLSITPSSGTLAPGASVTVTSTFNSLANALTAGDHDALLTFIDQTNSTSQTRLLTLKLSAAAIAQTISTSPVTPKSPTSPPFQIAATSSSNLPVSYSLLTGPASLSGTTVTLTGSTGAVTIRVSQPGDDIFAPAPDQFITFIVGTWPVFTKIASGPSAPATYAIRNDGTLWTWGQSNGGFNLAANVISGRVTPTQVGSVNTWIDISAGNNHGMALRSDGSLWSWGTNLNGQIGNGTTTSTTTPVQIAPSLSWQVISAGNAFSAAIASDGTLWTWGTNTNGQLGHGDTTQRNSPTQVGTSSNWTKVACGSTFVLAINTNQELWSWGANVSGQLGIGTTTTSLEPVRVGADSNWSHINSGNNFSIARRTDGTLWTWGSGASGQLGNGSFNNSSIPVQVNSDTDWTSSFAAGNFHAIALKTDGSAWCWGSNLSGQLGDGTSTSRSSPQRLSTTNDWSAVTAGITHIVAQKQDSTLWVSGEANTFTGLHPRVLTLATNPGAGWRDLSGSGAHFMAIRDDGTLWGWGNASSGALGNGSTTDRTTLTQIGTENQWAQVSAGNNSINSGCTMAVKRNGTLWAAGSNSSSNLGTGNTTTQTTFVQIGTDTNWSQVSCGTSHSMAVKTDGTLWGWGTNSANQLGLADTTTRSTPTQIGTDTDWRFVACGGTFSLGLKSNGTLWGWGSNSSGQLGDGTTISRTTPIQIGTATNWSAVQVGATHSIALRSNGTLWTWGSGANGQLGNGSIANRTAPTQVGTNTNWSRIAASNNSSAAITSDGALWVTGTNQSGQLGNGGVTTSLSFVRTGSASGYQLAAVSSSNLAAIQDNGSFWTAGTATARSLAGGRNRSRSSAILPILAPQTIEPPAASYQSWDSPVRIRSSSGLPTRLQIVSGPATASNDLVSFTGSGSVTLRAWQSGDESAWNAAPAEQLSFTVNNTLSSTFATSQSIGLSIGSFTASSAQLNLALGFAPTLGTVLTLVNNTGTDPIIGTFPNLPQGTSINLTHNGILYAFFIDYTGGDGNDITLTHDLANQTLSFTTISPKATTDSPFSVVATSSSGLPVTIEVVTGPATISNSQITLTGSPGAVTLRATQSGTPQFFPAEPVFTSFIVTNQPFRFSQINTARAGSHSLAISPDGSLWAWGFNISSQLGDGGTNTRYLPIKIGTNTTWTAVSAGVSHSLALRSNGTLWAWGLNSSNQLGDGTTTTRTTPVQIGTATNWSAIAAGPSHSLALRSDGTLWAWGANTSGQLGVGDLLSRSTPTQVGTTSDWQAIATGFNHTIALKSNGTLWAWGSGANGQLGHGGSNTNVAPVQIASAFTWQAISAGTSFSLAIRSDGALYAWGLNSSGQLGNGTTTTQFQPVPVGVDSDWQSIQAGGTHSMARKTNGTLWTWGANTSGQLGIGDVTNQSSPQLLSPATDWPQFSAGNFQSCALKSDGSLYSWGDGGGYTGKSVRSLTQAIPPGRTITVDSYSSHSIALQSNGTLIAWGLGTNGQLGTGSTSSNNPIQVGTATTWLTASAGGIHSGGVQQNGTLWMWGANSSNQLGDGTTTTRTAPFQLGTETNWAYVAAGSFHTNALKTNGSLWSWGSNSTGQLGLNDTTSRTTPVQVGSSFSWSKTAIGTNHSIGLQTNGTLWAWGLNSSGQLGLGDTTQRTVPTQIGNASDWSVIATNSATCLAIKSDRSLWAWGLNSSGQLGIGNTTNQSSPTRVGTANDWLDVSCGSSFTAALKTDGSLWVWGSNVTGQLGTAIGPNVTTPRRLTNITGWSKVSASNVHLTALHQNGSVWTAGFTGGLRLTSNSGRSQFALNAPVAPELAPQSITHSPLSNSASIVSASSGLPVSTQLISGSGSVSGNQLNHTGPQGTPAVFLVWQPGDETAWDAALPTQITLLGPSPQINLFQTSPSGPQLTSNLSSVDFNLTLVGQTLSQTFAITNTGDAPLNLSNFQASGDWSIDSSSSTNPLPPGQSTTFLARFTPTAPGPRSGTLTITSNSPENGTFTVALTGQSLLSQSLSFAPIPTQSADTPLTLSASATSNLPVTFTLTAGSDVATLVNSTLNFLTSGSVTIQASQPGNANFAPASPVSQTFSVNKGSQSLTFSSSIPASISHRASVTLSASSNRGLTPISFSPVSGPASLSGTSLSFSSPGTVIIEASQPGNNRFLPASALLSITATNATPNPSPLTSQTNEDSPLTGQLSATDNDGDPVTFIKTSNPSFGSVLVNANGSFTYSPQLNYHGPDSFTFKSNDGLVDSLPATVNLTILPINDAPTASPQSLSTPDSIPLTITLSASDIEASPLTYSIVAQPLHGTLTGEPPSVTYRSNPGYAGPDTFTFKANDGQADSAVASIEIDVTPVAPAITTPPQSLTLNPTTSATFSVSATGTQPITYQWRKNTVPIQNANASSYTLPSVAEADEGSYDVVITNSVGPITSPPATLSVNDPLTITTPPQSLTLNPTASATFSVSITGTTPVTYQWRKNTIPIQNATTSSLTLPSVAESDEGSYDVVITNIVGPITSSPATLSVNDPIHFLTHPISQIVSQTDPVTFSATVAGTEPLSFQWQKNGQPLLNQTQNTLVIPSAAKSDEGTYTVLVTNIVGTYPSNPATLEVIEGAPRIMTPPGHQLRHAGTEVHLNVTALGRPPLRYQWKKNGRPIPGATQSRLSFWDVTLATAGTYSVIVTSTSSIESPAIEVGIVDNTPDTQSIEQNASATFKATSAGKSLSHTWTKDSNPLPVSPRFIPSRDGKSLVIKNLTPDDAGLYRCIVTSPAGTLSGPVNELHIFNGPPTLTLPQNLPDGIVGGLYQHQVALSSGPNNRPSLYSATKLPPGVRIHPDTGLIEGRPTLPGTYQVTITASNRRGSSKTTEAVTITNLPADLVGTYTGIVAREPALNANLGGKLDFTVSNTAAYTGTLFLGTTRLPMKGTLEIDPLGVQPPKLSIRLKRPGSPAPQPVTLTFTLQSSTQTLASGSLQAPPNQTTVQGWRQTWHASANPATTRSGYHTLALEIPASDQGQSSIPQGNGFASFTVSSAGTLRLSGKLADGAPLTSSTFLGSSGQIAIFSPLYGSTPGSIVGTITQSLGTNLASPEDNPLSGSLSWSRPNLLPKGGQTYAAGFGPIALNVIGGQFTAPPLLLNVLPGLNNAQLQFAEAGLTASLTNPSIPLSIDASNKITRPTVNPAATTLKVTPATGAFSGSFTLIDPHWQSPPPATWRRTSSYQGLIIKNGPTYSGHGHFLLPQLPTTNPKTTPPPTLSGQVLLQTSP